MKKNIKKQKNYRKSGRRTQGWFKMLTFSLVFFSAMMLYVWQQIKVTQLAKENNLFKRQKENLINENKEIQIQIAAHSNLSRIEEIARNSVGMVYADEKPILLTVKQFELQKNSFLARFSFNSVEKFTKKIKKTLLPSAQAHSFN